MEYKAFDKIFAKVKGYPAWPARVSILGQPVQTSVTSEAVIAHVTHAHMHALREREVVGSIPGSAIPKALKMVPMATLLGAQHYKASTGSSLTYY